MAEILSRHTKSEEVFHREKLDHPHLLKVEIEGKANISYSLADIPRESQRPDSDVLFLKAMKADLAE